MFIVYMYVYVYVCTGLSRPNCVYGWAAQISGRICPSLCIGRQSFPHDSAQISPFGTVFLAFFPFCPPPKRPPNLITLISTYCSHHFRNGDSED